MKKLFVMKGLVLMIVAGFLGVAQAQERVTIPVNKTAPNDGKQMFMSYCASCHGADGRGMGPAAPALKVPPTDLTMLAQNNHGKFPGAHVAAVLQFGSTLPSHGSSTMPVWGPIFGGMSHTSSAQERQQRISNITRYIETIQLK